MERQQKKLKVGSSFNLEYLEREVLHFHAGNISHCLSAWEELTSDPSILDIIRVGLELNFKGSPPEGIGPFEYPRGSKEYNIIDTEVTKLYNKGVIETCLHEDGEYFSNLFTTPKKDGTYRTILNLKSLNKDCDAHHFKMESLKQALHMVRRGYYLASIDIKDAFYSVPIALDHRKYLKFMWNGRMYQFCAMRNGYCDAMRNKTIETNILNSEGEGI